MALIKVAIGIAKNTPQKPNMLPKINTASIITTGCNFTVSEKIIGTSKLPSRACKRRYKPVSYTHLTLPTILLV